jgi:hypothetical protein
MQDDFTINGNYSDLTLTQEKSNEAEANREFVLTPCVERINLHEEPGKLCDTIADYLLDKCRRFDNLLSYCEVGFLKLYQLGRSVQLQCIKNPPRLNDEAMIKLCLKVLQLNSSYTNRDPVVSLYQASLYPSSFDIDLLIRNPGSSPITFNSLGFDLIQAGENIFSGCVGKTSRGCNPQPGNIIKPFSSNIYNLNFDSTNEQVLNLYLKQLHKRPQFHTKRMYRTVLLLC